MANKKALGYALRGPDGKLFSGTFATDRTSCWSEALFTLEWKHRKHFDCDHMEWNQSVKIAKKLGYRVVRVSLVEV